MTTWTPKSQQAETWTATPLIAVFSPRVFSHAFYNGLRVFAVNGLPTTTWTAKTKQSETWTDA